MSNASRWVIPVVISAVLGYLLLGEHGLALITGRIAQTSVPGLAIFLVLWLLSTVARSLIYFILLQRRVRWLQLIPLMWVRSFAVDLLPARGGVVSIPAAMKLVWRIPVSSGIACLAGATIVEVVSLGIVLLVALMFFSRDLPPGWAPMLTAGGALLVLTLPAALYFAHRLTRLNGQGRAGRAIKKVAEETYLLKEQGRLLPTLGLTILTRIFKYCGLYSLFRALVPHGLNPVAFLSAMIAAEATSTLPVQGLAGVGTWEAAWVEVSSKLGLTSEVAVSSGFGMHLLVLAWEILMGGAGLLLLFRLHGRDRR